MTPPPENSLNSLNSFDNIEEWAEAQWDNWPDVDTDIQFGLNFQTYEFNYCIAYFSYWKWQIDMTLAIGPYEYYQPELMIQITAEDLKDEM